MKYQVINPKNPFYEHIFDGTPIIISGEQRIWDNDSVGRSYPLLDCASLELLDSYKKLFGDTLEKVDKKEMYMSEYFYSNKGNTIQEYMEFLSKALDESVKLQSHYAQLLNKYDGGERIIFKNSEEWLERLEKLNMI